MDGRPATLYGASAPPRGPKAPLAHSVRADVAVIGAGLCGLSAAWRLAARGRTVVVLEAAAIGAGASSRSGGQVHSGQRPELDFIERTLGREDALRLWDLAEAAKSLVREIAAHDQDGAFLAEGLIGAAASPIHFEAFEAKARHLEEVYDYAVEVLSRDELAAAIGTARFHGGVRDPGGFHLDPFRLVLSLAAEAERAGATLFEQTRADRLMRQDNRWRIATNLGPHVAAQDVLVAANGYLGRLVPAIAARVMPLKNFVAATAPLEQEMFARLIPGGEAVYDSRFVVRYWRPTRDRRIVFGGGESRGSGEPPDIGARVRPYFAEIYPQLANIPFEHAWSGTLAITRTRAPYVRRLERGLYTACGFSGQGVATAPFAGRVIADAILGEGENLDVFAKLPVPAFPGGTALRSPLLTLALAWYGLRDRLG